MEERMEELLGCKFCLIGYLDWGWVVLVVEIDFRIADFEFSNNGFHMFILLFVNMNK